MKKLLLDECLPTKFKIHLSGYDCLTVPEAGWAGKTNGEWLSLAENAGFQVFVSLDQGIEFQQNLTGRNIAVILPGAPHIAHFAMCGLRCRGIASRSQSTPLHGTLPASQAPDDTRLNLDKFSPLQIT